MSKLDDDTAMLCAKLLYVEWQHMHRGPSDGYQLILRPRWKAILSVPWLWLAHYRVSRPHATAWQSVVIATRLSMAFLRSVLRRKR